MVRRYDITTHSLTSFDGNTIISSNFGLKDAYSLVTPPPVVVLLFVVINATSGGNKRNKSSMDIECLPPEVAVECRVPTNMIDTSIFGLKDI